MALDYGVIPLHRMPEGDMGTLIANADELVREGKYAAPGDRIVIVAGWSPAMPNTMNGIIIHTVGEKWAIVRPAAELRGGQPLPPTSSNGDGPPKAAPKPPEPVPVG